MTRASSAVVGSDDSVAVTTTDGHSLSWDDLFREYAPAMVSYARSRGVRAPEDLVQDVLVTAVERLPEFEGDRRGLRSLLFTIAYRRIADEHRRYYSRQEVLVADHDDVGLHQAPVEETVTSRTTANEAMRAFEILSDRERKVLEMRIIDEATPADVAAALGLSNGNVRVIQARALVKVRKYLTALESGTRPMGSMAMALLFLRSLRSELPDDGGFTHWIDEIRFDAVAIDVTGPGGIATGALAAATGTGLLTAGVVKVGLFVTLATASAIGAVVVVDSPASTVPLFPTSGHTIDSTTGLTLPEPGAGATSPEGQMLVTPESGDERGPVAPLVPGGSPGVGPQTSDDTTPSPSSEQEALPVTPATEEVPNAVIDETRSAVDEIVQSVDDELVTPLVEDVVVPVIEEVVEPVVDEVIDPVVEDVVEPVVSEVIDPLLEEVVPPVDETIDTLLPAVGGLLPGLS